MGRSREVFASPSLRGWEQKELGERARGKIIVFYICIVFISPPHCFGEGCSFRINPLGAARDAFAGRTIFLPPQRGSVTRFMGWSSPKCRPGLAAGFWGFPCPYPAGFPPSPPPSKPSGSASAPHPEQNRFGIVSAGWCHRCDAGDASGDECVPPPRTWRGLRAFFSLPLRTAWEKPFWLGRRKTTGVGRSGEAVSSLVCKGERRRRVVPTLPGLPFRRRAAQTGGEALCSPDLMDRSRRSWLRRLAPGMLRSDRSRSPYKAAAASG